jgi:hypothetical protein
LAVTSIAALCVGHGRAELGLDPEGGQALRDRLALGGAVQLGRATAPYAFKRWLAAKEASDREALYRVMGACKLSLDPGSLTAAAKPGSCDADVRTQVDDAANRGT